MQDSRAMFKNLIQLDYLQLSLQRWSVLWSKGFHIWWLHVQSVNPKMTARVNLSAVFRHCVSSFPPSSKYLRMSQTSPFHGGKGQKGEEGDKMIALCLCSHVQMSVSDTSRVCAKAWVKHTPYVPFHPQTRTVPGTDSHIFSWGVSTDTDTQVSCKLLQPALKLPIDLKIGLSSW